MGWKVKVIDNISKKHIYGGGKRLTVRCRRSISCVYKAHIDHWLCRWKLGSRVIMEHRVNKIKSISKAPEISSHVRRVISADSVAAWVHTIVLVAVHVKLMAIYEDYDRLGYKWILCSDYWASFCCSAELNPDHRRPVGVDLFTGLVGVIRRSALSGCW